jgi:hypothetical protein
LIAGSGSGSGGLTGGAGAFSFRPAKRRSTSLSLCPAVLYGDDCLLRLGQITSEHERRAFTYENAREVK